MATYVISDIHGEYEKFMDILAQINLKEDDTLYVLGDVVDRGPHPIKVLQKLMEMHNAVCVVGNHEVMAIDCLDLLCREIDEISIEALDKDTIGKLSDWLFNGGKTTIDGFRALSNDKRREMIEFIKDFEVYEEVEAGGKEFLLVHAGLGGFVPGKDIEEYELHDLVWHRAEYDICYFEDKYVVTGHTPTQNIPGNDRPGYIFKQNNHIAIDCGACFPGGRLACIRLEDGAEFYAE